MKFKCNAETIFVRTIGTCICIGAISLTIAGVTNLIVFLMETMA